MFIKFGAPGDTGGGSGDTKPNPKDTDFVAKSVADQLEADRLAAFADRDKVKEEKRALQTQLDDIKRLADEEKATKDGNIEALRTQYTEREATLKAEKTAADKRINDLILKSDVLTVLSEVSVDAETAFLILKDDFEIKEVDGELRARPKKDTASVKDYILKKLESKPYLLKNNRAEGAATKKVDANGKPVEATTIPADIHSYDPAKLREWMRANPKLAAELATKAMGG